MDFVDDTISFEQLKISKRLKKWKHYKTQKPEEEEDTRCSMSDIKETSMTFMKSKSNIKVTSKDRFINLRDNKTQTMFRLHKISPDTGRDFDVLLKELKNDEMAKKFYYKEKLKQGLIDSEHFDNDPCVPLLGKRSRPSARKSILSFNSSRDRKPVFNQRKFQEKWSKFKKNNLVDTSPIKVLEAPGMKDDYYLNLLDWSRDNCIAIGLDSGVFSWNYNTSEVREIHTDNLGLGSVSCVKFNKKDGSKLCFTSKNGKLFYYDISKSSSSILSEKVSPQRISTVEWLDWNTMSFGSRNGFITIFDIRERNGFKNALHGHNHEICSLKWDKRTQRLASGGNDNLVNIYDIRKLNTIEYQYKHNAAVKALDWYPHKRGILYSGGGYNDKTIKVVNVLSKKVEKKKELDSQITGIICSELDRSLITLHGYPKNNMTMFSCENLNKVSNFSGHQKRILYYGLSPDKKKVATASSDESIKIWMGFKQSEEEFEEKEQGGMLDKAPLIR